MGKSTLETLVKGAGFPADFPIKLYTLCDSQPPAMRATAFPRLFAEHPGGTDVLRDAAGHDVWGRPSEQPSHRPTKEPPQNHGKSPVLLVINDHHFTGGQDSMVGTDI